MQNFSELPNPLGALTALKNDENMKNIVLALVASGAIKLPSVTISEPEISKETLEAVKRNVDIVRKLISSCS